MANDVSTDPRGNIYIAGMTNDRPLFGESVARGSALVAKFDQSASLVWSKTYAPDSTVTAVGVTVAKDGSTVIAGYTLYNSRSACARKYSVDGELERHKEFPMTGGLVTRIASDPQANIFVTGFTETSTFSNNPNPGSPDGFVAKYTPNGRIAWGQQISTERERWMQGVVMNPRDGASLTCPQVRNHHHYVEGRFCE